MEERGMLLFELFRDALGTVPFPKEHLSLLTEETVRSLYTLAKGHDLAQMLAEPLGKQGLLSGGETAEKLLKQQMLAVYRHERLNAAYERVCLALEEAEISYLPLKGSVIRPLYPQPYFRTSCDIDILVKEEALQAAVAALSAVLPLEKEPERAYHDVSLHFMGGIHLELHFSLLERSAEMDKVLSRVWDYTLPEGEGLYRQKMTEEFFLFHQIAHAAYHFKMGGCGIRPLMDVFLILQKRSHDAEKLNALLSEASLFDFYTHFVSLARVWFLGEPHTAVTKEMERYLLSGGVYGSFENKLTTATGDGRFLYLLKRVFPPFRALSVSYPRLAKHPALYPFYIIKRFFRIFNGKKRKRAVEEVKQTAALSDEKRKDTAALFSALGLRDIER